MAGEWHSFPARIQPASEGPGFGPRLGPVPAVDPIEIKEEDFNTIMAAIQANGLMVQPVGEIIALDR
jgi:hypothetical protein